MRTYTSTILSAEVRTVYVILQTFFKEFIGVFVCALLTELEGGGAQFGKWQCHASLCTNHDLVILKAKW